MIFATKFSREIVTCFAAILLMAIAGNFGFEFSSKCLAVQGDQDTKADTDEKKKLDEKEKLSDEQNSLAKNYTLLENKLFELHQFEKEGNPDRADLLKRAFELSKENLTGKQMEKISQLLNGGQLMPAEQSQAQVVAELEALLKLLQSENRSARVRSEIEKNKAYLKEVNRILRIQQGIRGQAEGGVDEDKLAQSQKKTADRTKNLNDEIKSVEQAEAGEDGGESAQGDKPSDGGKPSDSQKSDGKSDDKKDDSKEDKKDDSKSDKPSDDEKSKDENKDDKKSKGKPSSGKSGPPGESGEPGEGESSPEDQPSDDPVQQKLKAAEQKMRDAQMKLEKAKRDQSIEDMREAERELEEANRELEEILRQLREEEIGRVLAMLEGRFRKMLQREIQVYETTRKLDRVLPEQRGPDFEIRAGKMSAEQREVLIMAQQALMLLREDGSSIAFPETVEAMAEDMEQVSIRLSAAKVSKITQSIEEDIIDTLDYMIEALVKAQEDLESGDSGGGGGGGGEAGDQALVDQLAEVKMIRGLQHRIHKRHKRYSMLLDDPEDEIGQTNDPDIRSALNRLSERQEKLYEITRDIVNGKNR